MYIINLVDTFTKINFGIWNSAVSTAMILEENHGCHSLFYYHPTSHDVVPPEHAKRIRPFISLDEIFKEEHYTPLNTVIVSHGCWRYPSREGAKAAAKGYKWVYVPHGMLEPWSLQQKRIKKLLYYSLAERRYIHRASAIRAVSVPERENLESLLNKKVTHIPNGIAQLTDKSSKNTDKIIFLFMARLHHKKGVIPLIEAWISSSLLSDERFQLTIAGPDDGELPKIKDLLSSIGDGNIRYIGAVYGKEKDVLLANSHYYVLPSFSEGFPTSVLEAMQFGLIPLISRGCNFPEVFINNLGLEVKPTVESLKAVLEEASKMKSNEMYLLAEQVRLFVQSSYSLNVVAQQQHKLYTSLLSK